MTESPIRPISVKIIPGEPDFDRAVMALSRDFHAHRVTFFCGAGVSAPSGLPGSESLVSQLVEVMVESLARTGVGHADEHLAVQTVIKNYPLERLLEALVGIYEEETALSYLDVLKNTTPNYNHEAIARLAAMGLIDHVITLNFDVLFEQALQKQAVPFSWNLPLSGESSIPKSGAQVSVIKPHGTLSFNGLPYEQHYLAATLRYAGDRPQKENEQIFQTIAHKCPVLLVAGYSDNDWDISPLLTAAPWSHVYWCEYVTPDGLQTPPSGKPCQRILKWLGERPENSTTLLYGDIRTLLSSVLQDGNAHRTWANEPIRKPDASIFLRNPEATALATVRILDGTANALYLRLLPQLGTIPSLVQNDKLRKQWQRFMSWMYHAHKRDIREAIAIIRKVMKEPTDSSPNQNLDYLSDLKALYYEYISAAKRPYLNFYWPLDLLNTGRVEKMLQRQALKVKVLPSTTSWTIKEVERQEAYAAHYKVDLLHNWGYHLLPFNNWFICKIRRIVFSKIATRYAQLRDHYPILDWEYFYARGVEAALIAGIEIDQANVREKLQNIAHMFNRTGFDGHFQYLQSLDAIITNSEKLFDDIEQKFFDENSGTSPAGKLRMRLFRRRFWPETTSLLSVLKDLVKYSAVQK